MGYIGKTPTPSALTASDITDGIISESKLASDAVTTGKISDGTIAQADISDQAINEAKMQISNSPTNGYFLSAQSGNTGGMTWAEVSAGGGLTLLQTTSVTSAVSVVTIGSSSLFSSTYDFYVIRGRIRPASNGQHGYMRVRTSAGQRSGSDYKFNRMWQYSGSGTVSTDNSGGATQFNFFLGQSVHGTHGCVFEIFLAQPNNSSVYKPISVRTVNADTSDDSAHHLCGGLWVGGTDALTGIDLFFSSGNVDTGGLITLHGVNKS